MPCGDGVCDDAEKGDASLCPRDCLDKPAKGDDWCGDGICDALEQANGDCSADCTGAEAGAMGAGAAGPGAQGAGEPPPEGEGPAGPPPDGAPPAEGAAPADAPEGDGAQ